MSVLRINSNDSFAIEMLVRESDKYTEDVYFKLSRHYIPEQIDACDEMFFSVEQLEQIGNFILAQANEIKQIQKRRNEI